MTEYRAKRRADRSRALAVEVLLDVTENGAFANLVLPRVLRAEQSSNRNFDFRDAAFTSELVYGTLRWRSYLDTVLSNFSSRPLADLDAAVLEILRIGAYQLLFMRVPDHAAVAETVDVAREMTTDGPAKMVNAILRSITRATPDDIDAIFSRSGTVDEELAARYSHPEWMIDVFRKALNSRGLSASLEAALQANNDAPRVNLVARPGLITAGQLAAEVEEVLGRPTSQGMVSEYAVLMDGGDPGALPSLRDARAAVQDEGSQLAALLLADFHLQGRDKYWLDLCAGPGGKAALLAAVGAERGAELIANEVNQKRASLVKRSVQALPNVEVVCADGRDFRSEVQFDRVLVDAPCSGLGSLRRRPESRWNHNPEDLQDLLPLQRDLLASAVRLSRPGGIIAYVTCTPDVRETLDQVEWAISNFDLDLLDSATLAQNHVMIDLEGSGDHSTGNSPLRKRIIDKTVQLWPHLHGADAMFIALMQKRRINHETKD